jgi:CO/xanthine dehydrogenase Mo-binding subunit
MQPKVVTEVTWHGPQVRKAVRELARRALWKASRELLKCANKRVPLDKGFLKRSGDTRVDARELEAVIFYDTPYAVRLHEHPEYRFQRGREGKWLEKTIEAEQDRVLEWLAEELNKL